jgi:hypothetical protein
MGTIKNTKYYLNKQEKKDYINITIVNKEKAFEEVKCEDKKEKQKEISKNLKKNSFSKRVN